MDKQKIKEMNVNKWANINSSPTDKFNFSSGLEKISYLSSREMYH